MRMCIGLLLAVGVTHAEDSAAIEARLGKTLLAGRQTLIETQVYLGSLVKPMPSVRGRADWDTQSRELRRNVLDHVVFRGAASEWRNLKAKAEWQDVIAGQGYRIRKFRYEILPGLWLPGLLYEPARLTERMPVVVNVNGHEGEGVAISYIQQRCIHLARSGLLAFNFEWFGKGQMSGPGYDHGRLNQIDLTGTSGVAPFFLAARGLLDVALQHPNVDADRVAVTGLSGGGWQTITLSALDERVKLSAPVAGYSSFVTRTQFPEKDLGDSEQTPADLGRYADYTHLTAMLAPRPALLTYNAFDNCCFRADYAVAPLLVTARPYYQLYDAQSRLRYHANFDSGHNYGLDNRQALYRFLREFFFTAGGGPPDDEAPAELQKAAALRVELLQGNHDLHTLAAQLSAKLPRDPEIPARADARLRWQNQYRERLRELTRWPDYRVTGRHDGRVSLDGIWTVPTVEFAPANATGTTLILGDDGKARLTRDVGRLVAAVQRVVAMDPFYFGECRLPTRDYLFALLASAVGQRPLGIEAGQVAAVARSLKTRYGPVAVEAHGRRTSLIALVAAAVETDAIAGVRLFGPMRSLKEPIEKSLSVTEAPELFCFGLLEWFDMAQIEALVSPRPVTVESR